MRFCDAAKKRFRDSLRGKDSTARKIDARTRLRSEEAVIYSPRFVSPTPLIAGNSNRALVGKAENPTRGARCMGLILLVVIWLITFVSTYFFIAKTCWLPVGASAAAAAIDPHFTVSFTPLAPVFFAPPLPLAFFF